MEFQKWIKQKYSEWSNGSKSESQFAVYLGISQASLNAWFNGIRGKPTSSKIINRLINIYGDEVYDVLGLNRSTPVPIESLPDDVRAQLVSALKEIKARSEQQQIEDPNSSAGRALVRQVFAEHGLKITSIE
jgi:transcriptional regulator with XRE-family HTH domain